MTATLKVDTIKEVNSSTNNLVLDSSGNVTVGNNLTVTGTTTFTGGQTFNGTLTLNTPSTTTARNINWSNGTGTVATIAGYSDSTTTGHLEFYTLQSGTSPTEQARIDQYGSLLVGTTTSPTTTTGLGTISTPGTVVMGSSFLRNRIINGGMQIWQRGTTFSSPSGTAYTADRWQVFYGGTAPSSYAQTTGPSGYQYAMRITGTSGNTSAGLAQKIESVNCSDLSGQTITVSANLKASSNQTVLWYLYYANSADNFSAYTAIGGGTWSATTTATNFFGTQTNLPSGATNGLYLVIFANNGGAFTSGTLDITGVQLEVGSVATPFERRQYGQELALCQRYYQTTFNAGIAPAQNVSSSMVCLVSAPSNNLNSLTFQVPMRAAPTTITTYNPFSANSSFRQSATPSTDIAVTPSAVSSYGIGYFSATISAGTSVLGNLSMSAEL